VQDFRVSVNDDNEIVFATPISEKFTDSFNKQKGYRLPRSKMGSCQYNCVDFPEEMTFADIGKVTVLVRKHLMSGNALGYKKNNRIYWFTASDEIGKAVGINSRTHGCEFVNRIQKFLIIKKVNGKFYVNPVFFLKNGEWLTFELFAIFYMDVRVMLPSSLYCEMFEECMRKGLLNGEDYQKAKALMK
jgi:hypothetical protein